MNTQMQITLNYDAHVSSLVRDVVYSRVSVDVWFDSWSMIDYIMFITTHPVFFTMNPFIKEYEYAK